jgi:O-antigen ligase
MYLSYGVQLGVVGLCAFVAMIGGILAVSWWRTWTATTDAMRRFFAVVALASLGIFLNGVTSVVFSSNLFAYVFFLCAGAAMTAAWETPSASRLPAKG